MSPKSAKPTKPPKKREKSAKKLKKSSKDPKKPAWQNKLAKDLRLMGHRNWIVIADAAYPAQSNPGIKTVITGSGQIETVQGVLEVIADAPHIRPILHLDSELQHISETDAPGVSAYREELERALEGRDVQTEPHEEIIAKLDEAGKIFRVLILKTDLTIPYTSLFIKLDCGYWSPEAEKRLRTTIKKKNNPTPPKPKPPKAIEKPVSPEPTPPKAPSPWHENPPREKK